MMHLKNNAIGLAVALLLGACGGSGGGGFDPSEDPSLP